MVDADARPIRRDQREQQAAARPRRQRDADDGRLAARRQPGGDRLAGEGAALVERRVDPVGRGRGGAIGEAGRQRAWRWAARPAPNAAAMRARSSAIDSARRLSATPVKPPRAATAKPNRPVAGSKCSTLAGGLAARATNRSPKRPPSTSAARPSAKRATARDAGSARSRTCRRRERRGLGIERLRVGRAQQHRAAGAIGDAERAGAGAAREDRHFGLGEQRQQIGAGAAQLDLDHLGRDGEDLDDRAEHRLQRVAAGRRRSPRAASAPPARHRSRRDRRCGRCNRGRRPTRPSGSRGPARSGRRHRSGRAPAPSPTAAARWRGRAASGSDRRCAGGSPITLTAIGCVVAGRRAGGERGEKGRSRRARIIGSVRPRVRLGCMLAGLSRQPVTRGATSDWLT